MRLFARTLVALLVCTGMVPGVSAYLGEDPGFDLYRTVDRSSGLLESRLMQKYLRGSGSKANELIGKICRNDGWEPVYCLDGRDFSDGELFSVLYGENGVAALRGRMDQDISSVSTETISAMLSKLQSMREALASDAREERRGMELFGSVGLFADGSIDNSGYDLVYDIEQINKIIFKQPPTYSGLRNSSARDIGNVLAGNFGDDAGDEAAEEEAAETATGTLLGGEVSGAPSPRGASGVTATGSTVPASLCPPVGGYPSDFLTAGVISLPAVTVAAASGVTATGAATEPSEPTLPFVAQVGDGVELSDMDGSRDSYSCRADQIFCIEIKFAKYKESFGFGGGLGGNSIEDVLDQNLKIFDKYSSSSFAQARMTNNFFELSLKDIDLPSMGHIGTVITKKPPPILNIGKSGEQSDEDVAKEDEKEFDEIFSRSFSAYGLDYGRQNDLTNNCVDYQLTLVKNLSTDKAPDKLQGNANCQPGGSADELYPAVKAESQKEDYYRTFSKDLNEIGRFVDTLAGNISDSIGVIKGINAIPSSK